MASLSFSDLDITSWIQLQALKSTPFLLHISGSLTFSVCILKTAPMIFPAQLHAYTTAFLTHVTVFRKANNQRKLELFELFF